MKKYIVFILDVMERDRLNTAILDCVRIHINENPYLITKTTELSDFNSVIEKVCGKVISEDKYKELLTFGRVYLPNEDNVYRGKTITILCVDDIKEEIKKHEETISTLNALLNGRDYINREGVHVRLLGRW